MFVREPDTWYEACKSRASRSPCRVPPATKKNENKYGYFGFLFLIDCIFNRYFHIENNIGSRGVKNVCYCTIWQLLPSRFPLSLWAVPLFPPWVRDWVTLRLSGLIEAVFSLLHRLKQSSGIQLGCFPSSPDSVTEYIYISRLLHLMFRCNCFSNPSWHGRSIFERWANASIFC